MLKTKVKGIPFKFAGETIPRGEKLVFKAINTDGSIFDVEKVKGKKIISIFPDINTSICDAQTMKISQLDDKHKNVTFISISLDKMEMQQNGMLLKV